MSVRRVVMFLGAVAVGLLTIAVLEVTNTVSTVVVVALLCTIVVAGLLTWLIVRAPVAITVTLLIASAAVVVVQERSSLLTERTFYGSYRVRVTADQHLLLHGTTIHGTQFLDAERSSTATTYYAPDGPFGDLLGAVDPDDLAVVGLGAGAIAAYGSDVPRITFFEIDPVVADIAKDPRWFTYLADSAAAVDIVVGDGRLAMAEEPEAAFDLVALDAFSSDSIPVHILTREGIAMFLDRVRPEGALAIHISNRIFDLRPVLAAHARDLGLHAMIGRGGEGPGAEVSEWVVLTRAEQVADQLAVEDRWAPLQTSETVKWTDDYSSVLSVLR